MIRTLLFLLLIFSPPAAADPLVFLPTEPDTLMGQSFGPDLTNPTLCGTPHVVRIILPDSQMVLVPVWWVKRVEARLDSLDAALARRLYDLGPSATPRVRGKKP